jgi:hypothetical protein
VITLGAGSDDTKAAPEPSRLAISLGVRAACVGEQERDGVAKHLGNVGGGGQRHDELVDDVTSAHRDAARGDRFAADELGGVSQEALEHGRAEARPDQSRSDVLVRSIELVQVGVGLPFLKQQFDLPVVVRR